jgi:hypothetical protein
MNRSLNRRFIAGAALALAAVASPALAQDAANGYRLYSFTSTLKGTAQSCTSCHGENPWTPPNAMLTGVNIGTACGQAWPQGTAHALKGLCNIGAGATQADAAARLTVGLAQPQMAQFSGLTTAERADLAAFLLATYKSPGTFPPVPVARPEYQAQGATSPITTLNLGSVSDGATAQLVVYFVNAGSASMQIGAGFVAGPAAITGLNAARFSVSSTVPGGETACAANLTLNAGARCALTVTFSPDPTVIGGALQTATLTIPSNGGSGVSQLSLNGSRAAVAAPTLTLTPAGTSLNAGPTPAGTSVNFAPITVTNNGTAVLNFASITIGGTDAAEFGRATGGSHCAVGTAVGNGGGTCTLQFTFSPPPGATGTRTATVDIASNAPGSPLRLTLTGTVGTVAPTIAFGTTSNTNQAFLRLQSGAVGAVASGVVTVRNAGISGAPSLTIGNVQLAAGAAPTFAVTQDNCTGVTLAPAGSCTLNVSYTPPNMAVPHSGSIVITSNGRTTAGIDGPHDVRLEGTILVAGSGNTTAVAPNAPAVMRFQNTPVNTLSTQIERITVSNTGASALTVEVRLGAALSDFSVVNGCTSIAAGNSCFIDVRFRPRGEGLRSDTLSLSYNGGVLPSVSMSGIGQAATTQPAGGTQSGTAAEKGAGGGAIPLSWLLGLMACMLLAVRIRRRD